MPDGRVKSLALRWSPILNTTPGTRPPSLPSGIRCKPLINQYAHINDTVLGRKGPGRRGQVEKFLMVDKDQLQRAIDKQILMPTEPASAEDIAMLIFRSGFSTAETVTEISGRGVGMDAAMSFEALRARALAGKGRSAQAV